MAFRYLRRHLTAIAALLLLVALVVPSTGRDAAAARPVARVYILEGGDNASDQAVAQTLRARGLNVTRGVATHRFNGTQADLTSYDVVVVLYTAHWDQAVPAEGIQAIRSFVEGGGGLVTGEWFGWRGQLGAIMPATNCGYDDLTSTTYTQLAPNPQINAGLPISFSFSLGNFGGSESCLEARPAATVFYGSTSGGAGLAAWNVGLGRVAAFSTLLSATELANPAYRTLFQNTVAWSADVRDATPPIVHSVRLDAAGGVVQSRNVEMQIKASDRGGSGVGSFIVAEYVPTSDGTTWSLANTSGWRRYRQPSASFALTLADTPGVHYLHVYAADRAGNVSRNAVIVFVNYQALGPTAIGLDEAHLYRVTLADIPQVTARMQVSAGNPDLYVKGPGVLLTPQSDASLEELTFAAVTPGVYELGVIGFQAGAYMLSYGPAPLTATATDGDIGIFKRGRGSVINIAPDLPPENPVDLPTPPLEPEAGPEPAIYFPAIQQP